MMIAFQPSLLSRGDGHRLAIQLLRELEGASHTAPLGATAVSCGCPDIEPPARVLLRHLFALSGAAADEAMAGFIDVVADFMAHAVDGMVLDGDHYERLLADHIR